MSDEHKKPDPIEDVRKGLGLLFRAARTAVDEIPTDKIEEAVKTGAREVTRVVESVTTTIEKELFPGANKTGATGARPASQPPPPAHEAKASDATTEARKVEEKVEEKDDKKAEKPPIVTPPPDDGKP